MPKAVCGSNRPKRTASNSHWFALLLSCIGPVIPNTAKAVAEEPRPTEDSARYVVTTFADVTYFGAVTAAPDNPDAVVITPRTGAPQVVPNRQIAGKWLATDLAAYGPRQVVRSGCTGESRPRLLVREITAASQPPFLAKVLEVKVGDHIRVQRVDAAARDAQVREPTDRSVTSSATAEDLRLQTFAVAELSCGLGPDSLRGLRRARNAETCHS